MIDFKSLSLPVTTLFSHLILKTKYHTTTKLHQYTTNRYRTLANAIEAERTFLNAGHTLTFFPLT